MEAAAASVTEQALQLAAFEHPGASRHFHRKVHDFPGRLDGVVLGRNDLRGPSPAMIDTVRRVFRLPAPDADDRVEGQHHLRNRMMDLWVIGHAAADPERGLALFSPGNARSIARHATP